MAPEFRTAITITGLVTFIALYHYVQIPFLIILYQLFIGLGDAIARQPASARGQVSAARYLTVLAWLFYPIVFLFPMLGLTGARAETAVQFGYSIADIVAKAVFGLLIYTIAVIKTDSEAA